MSGLLPTPPIARTVDRGARIHSAKKTRQFARQMVSHGHIVVNGKKLTIPSHKVRPEDIISVREGSKNTGLFTTLAETHESAGVPAWLSFDLKKMEGKVTALPTY